jgi:enediyne polyketide synthase
MSHISREPGRMANIGASADEVERLIPATEKVVVACLNGPRHTVVSGESEAVERVVSSAQSRGWTAGVLPTADAFHSPLMMHVAEPFDQALATYRWNHLRRTVISTITGATLSQHASLRQLLVQQLTSPVLFANAIAATKDRVDLFIEVGPGSVLTNLIKGLSSVPTISLDVPGHSLAGLCKTVAAAFALGANPNLSSLFKDRFTRAFDLDRQLKFFSNPCELAPLPEASHNLQPRVSVSELRKSVATCNSERELTDANSVQSDAIDIMRNLVARRAELPSHAIAGTARLLGDLHLNSIVVGEIVVSAARELGISPPDNVLRFADATLGEVAQELEQLRNSSDPVASDKAVPAGVDDWYRAFRLEWSVHPLREFPPGSKHPPGKWRIFGPLNHPLRGVLSEGALPGTGVAVCMSVAPVEEQLSFLLTSAHAAIAESSADVFFVVLGPVGVASAFARTLNIEHPNILTRVIESLPAGDAIRHLHTELSDQRSHVEARYSSDGQRYEPYFQLLDPPSRGSPVLRPGTVVLVSGGAKGIASKCAATLAKDASVKLVLFGRSPEDDPLVCAQVRELETDGIFAKYVQADVRDARAVQATVHMTEQMFGHVAGVIHGAGHNEPILINDLDEARMLQTLAPKVQGLRNLLAAVDSRRLQLLITFGSVIGRVGLRGESHYALANACLSELTEQFACEHPKCCCIAFETSAWSEIGMAERLGTVETLRRKGIVPITPSVGIGWFRRLTTCSLPAATVVVTGRLGEQLPVPMGAPTLPARRFLDRPRVHYPEVELVVDADLTTGSDPYLLDHVFHGQPLLPAVMGLEAMAQTAMAVCARSDIPIVENARFEHPIVVEPGGRVTLRIAALVRERNRIEVVIRSSATSFRLDHFHCMCVFDEKRSSRCAVPIPEFPGLQLAPERDLYGRLLFQGQRFQRLYGYRRLSARFSWADIRSSQRQAWFSPYLPGELTLGDAGLRDAAVHSIQACVPDATLLPLSVDRICLAQLNTGEPLIAHGFERWQEGNDYCYDLELLSEDGQVREYWHGLRLRKVANPKAVEWPDALVAPLLEWRIRRALGGIRVAIALERNSHLDHRSRTERAILHAVDRPCSVHWQSNGKPEVDVPLVVSATHSGDLTMAVAAAQMIACDMEGVSERSEEMWRDLLGLEPWLLAKSIANLTNEDVNTAATRVWTTLEALAKAAIPEPGPMSIVSTSINQEGVAELSCSGMSIATLVVRCCDEPKTFVISVLTRSGACGVLSTDTESLLTKQT